MPADEHTSNAWESIVEYIKSVNVLVAILIVPAWRWIDKYFDYRKGRDREFIKNAAKEGVREETARLEGKLDNIRNEFSELKRQQQKDREDFNDEIKEILRERR